MYAHPFILRLVVISFMVLVGFSIAKSIQSESPLGFGLGLLSLGAGVYFVYLLHKIRQQKKIS